MSSNLTRRSLMAVTAAALIAANAGGSADAAEERRARIEAER